MNHALLNALVAERVMGWPRIGFSDPVPDHGYIRLACAYFGGKHSDRCGIFQPATNIAHAHEMRDKVLRENDWIVGTVALVSDVDKKLRVCVEVRVRGSVAALAEIERRESEPEALCLAFLRALGVTDKEIEEVANV